MIINNEEEKFLSDVFLTLENFIKETNSRDHLVVPHDPDSLKKKLPQISSTGESYDTLIKELKLILESSVNTAHPLFLNQLFGGFDPAAFSGDVVSSLLNPTMATYEIAPMLTVIEKRLVEELLKLFGFKKGEGIMVTGGSNSNLVATLCARTNYNPSIRQTGYSHNQFRVYVSAEAHYSFDKAVNIAGIGTQNLILIPCDDQGRMIPQELERIILSDIKNGFIPIMVGATSGSTVLGAFDPLPEIARICERYKIWFHVDAAWGGGAIFSETHKVFLKGIERADSVTFDAHKTMGVPLVTSFFLTRLPGILRTTNRGGGSEYLFHEYDNSDWDTGTYSLQCGRKADALKLWFLWRQKGTSGLQARMQHLLDLASYTTKKIESNTRFKLIHANYLNVCFQILPKNNIQEEKLNEFNLNIRKALLSDAKAFVNYAKRPDGTTFFRLVFPNNQTRKEHVDRLIELIIEKADTLTYN